METGIDKVYKPLFAALSGHRLFIADVPAGFPSPAADYEEAALDLNKFLITNPAATFFVRAAGDSMLGAGIHCGDLLVVDRSLETRDKNVVLAVVNGEFTVKRIRIKSGKITLQPENDHYKPSEIAGDMEFEVWGVVTFVLHKL